MLLRGLAHQHRISALKRNKPRLAGAAFVSLMVSRRVMVHPLGAETGWFRRALYRQALRASVDAMFQHLFQPLCQELTDFGLSEQILADPSGMLLPRQGFGLFPLLRLSVATTDPEKG